MSAAPRIVRLLSVVDTREYVEEGDRWVPIPGSGQERECSRCSRTHEVHAEVELEDGTRAVVGTGCASRDSMDTSTWSSVKSGDRAAKRLARLRAELAALQKRRAAWEAACAEVDALPFPEVKYDAFPSELPLSARSTRVRMGDVSVVILRPTWFDAERRSCLEASWRHNRMAERGFTEYRGQFFVRAQGLEKEISRLLKRHPELAPARAAAA